PNPTPPYTNWAMAAHSIQDAVDLAATGDTILVTNGFYSTGSTAGPAGLTLARVMVTKALELRTMNGPELTIIDGGGTNQCVAIVTTNGALVSGFTLTNGLAPWGGGGAFGSSRTSCILTNCILAGNRALFGGGVFFCALYDCSLISNTTY